jgi:murein DD-endopeptidase MepM/ murein hydrolase activator NlpD
MKFRPSTTSTVIIVDKGKGSTKTLQVKTKHINRLKHYAAGIMGVIALLAGIIIYLDTQNSRQEQENSRLQAQITKMENAAPVVIPQPVAKTEVKAPDQQSKAETYIQSIEGKLKSINNYLKKRGLKGFSIKSIGGGDSKVAESKLSDNEKYSLYDEYLSRLERAVAFTPMGYPRVSSLTSYFGYRSDPFDGGHAEFHPGIDFKGQYGDPARCTANGRVVSAGWMGGYGNCVRIAHANGYETLYGHLSHISVHEGQEVTAGQVIGKVGSTGRSTGTHLHYEVRKNGKAINPISFLSLNN